MRKAWCCVLVGVLAATTGCGHAPVGLASAVQARALHARSVEASAFAKQFYDQLKPRFSGSLRLDDGVVTVGTDDPTTYDFGATPATRKVAVHTSAFDTTVGFDDLMQGVADDGGTEVLPALLLPIAVQLSVACVESFVIYYAGHHGDNFNRGDAIKAMAIGMTTALIPFLGELKYVQPLVPFATHVLEAAPALTPEAIAKAVVPLLGELVSALREIIKARKAAHDAG